MCSFWGCIILNGFYSRLPGRRGMAVLISCAMVMTAAVIAAPGQASASSTITSPPQGGPLNNSQSIEPAPVTCGFDPADNGPFTFGAGLAGTAEPATSMSLPAGAADYFYVGSDAGGNPLTGISWNPDLSVTAAYSGNEAVSVGQSSSDSASFSSGTTTNVAIAGLGVTGYQVTGTPVTAATTTGTSVSLKVTTGAGELLLVVVGGEGVGLLQQGGTPLSTLLNVTYSECGSDVIASAGMFAAFLPAGTNTVTISGTTYPTNAGTSMGAVAYVLAPTCVTTTRPDRQDTTLSAPGQYLVLSAGAAAPNVWAISSSSSSSYIEQCTGSGGVKTSISLSNLTYALSGPAGFTEVGYGYSSYDEPYCVLPASSCASATAPFPIAMKTILHSGLRASVTYDLGPISPGYAGNDLSYDLWIERSPGPGAGPGCDGGICDIEVEISPFNSYDYGQLGALCGAVSEKDFSNVPAVVNGVPQSLTWDVYKGCGAVPGDADTVHFVLPDGGRPSGSITLSLADFVKHAAEVVSERKQLPDMRLMGVEVGTEYDVGACVTLPIIGNACGSLSSSVSWDWTISSLSLVMGKTTIRPVP